MALNACLGSCICRKLHFKATTKSRDAGIHHCFCIIMVITWYHVVQALGSFLSVISCYQFWGGGRLARVGARSHRVNVADVDAVLGRSDREAQDAGVYLQHFVFLCLFVALKRANNINLERQHCSRCR